MQKKYTSLGLMSGTSGDGVDASIIHSNGIDQSEVIKDKYFEYDSSIYKKIHFLKDRIFNIQDLSKYSFDLKQLERDITLFHAKITKELNNKDENMIIGFHGQTIYHNAEEKISKQLGDGYLLNQLTKKRVIFKFRENDILNSGEGAPLTPIYHQHLVTQKRIDLPVCVLNIGGISNITIIKGPTGSYEIFSKDIGPGNCLIDTWVRKNSIKKFDENGQLAARGNINEIIFEQAQELYTNRQNKNQSSFDTNDFDVSFTRGLSLEDGAATLTSFTARIISESICTNLKKDIPIKVLVCGGGRKNNILFNSIKKSLPDKINLSLIDDIQINGDFVESQAFAFLAIRSLKKLPITFPNTTKCRKPISGGEIIEN